MTDESYPKIAATAAALRAALGLAPPDEPAAKVARLLSEAERHARFREDKLLYARLRDVYETAQGDPVLTWIAIVGTSSALCLRGSVLALRVIQTLLASLASLQGDTPGKTNDHSSL